VSAQNDYANQVILSRGRKVDGNGDRNLGVITKPNCLPTNSGSEAAFVSLAKNEDVLFKLGWHVVQNRSYDKRGSSFEVRNHSESAFFDAGKYASLPRDMVGIKALREHLSQLLLGHIRKELPSLKVDLEDRYSKTLDDLEKFGDDRKSLDAQRRYLLKLSMTFYDLAKAATTGYYEADYFAERSKFLAHPRTREGSARWCNTETCDLFYA
jgi:Dynamin central region